MKPIEEGCLAIIVNDEDQINNGKIVRVGKFLGKVTCWSRARHWAVDRDIIYPKFIPPLVEKHVDEFYLMRIDGEEFEDERETEKVLTNETN